MNKDKNQALDPLMNKGKNQAADSDTYSDGLADVNDPKVAARRRGRANRRQYKDFIRENKKFWMWFNGRRRHFGLLPLAVPASVVKQTIVVHFDS